MNSSLFFALFCPLHTCTPFACGRSDRTADVSGTELIPQILRASGADLAALSCPFRARWGDTCKCVFEQERAKGRRSSQFDTIWRSNAISIYFTTIFNVLEIYQIAQIKRPHRCKLSLSSLTRGSPGRHPSPARLDL